MIILRKRYGRNYIYFMSDESNLELNNITESFQSLHKLSSIAQNDFSCIDICCTLHKCLFSWRNMYKSPVSYVLQSVLVQYLFLPPDFVLCLFPSLMCI